MTSIPIATVAGDGEPRVRDADLAERLGYANVKNFRSLIRANEKYLRKINQLRERRDRCPGGARAFPDANLQLGLLFADEGLGPGTRKGAGEARHA